MKLPFGITISFNGNGNGKYVKKDECSNIHKDLEKFIRQEFINVSTDRNQKLIELKQDLTDLINIKFDTLKK